VDRARRARRDAGHAAVAGVRAHDVVVVVVRDRVHGADGLAGVAADADLGVDQVLLDDSGFNGHVHVFFSWSPPPLGKGWPSPSGARSKTRVKAALDAWFDTRGWKPFKFQRDVWKAIAQGQSGLLHATTGAGKTYAVWLGALQAFSQARKETARPSPQPLT
ncbi:hypothetical protein KXX48_000422, partial [Aspergillus fumigatus]